MKNSFEFVVCSFQRVHSHRVSVSLLKTKNSQLKTTPGFTLIETLVAISLVAVAIVAPMGLVVQSLTTARYARDQVTAYNLAQEGIEAVRAVRDANILENAINNTNVNLLTNIPIGAPFRIDATQVNAGNAIVRCDTDPGGTCLPLYTDGTLYDYDQGGVRTQFTRILTAQYVGAGQDEIRVSVTVSWPTPSQVRSFTIYENMYRWVEDGSAGQ